MDALVKTVGSAAFRELAGAGNGIILDVRTPEEVAAGYIEGAVNMNVRGENFREQVNALPKDKDIYVYCRSGKRSLTAAGILCESGFKQIYNLKDGITGWVEDGLPVSKQE
ncbi:hypothetical protein FACS1894181_18630 [Bacteroidia bacterium]|nr:hypothetical protein FACS1894181_18630 [Bacteroidia bacterium]